MKNKVIAITTIICIILLCCAGGFYMKMRSRIPENPRGTIGNTAGNLYNKGLFCESDGYVYFANPYDNNTLYCMRSDESEVKKLVATSVSSINAGGKYLYYYQEGSGGGAGLGFLISTTGVYRVEKNRPSNVECLDRILGKYVLLVDNSVYYTCSEDNLTTNRVDIDGENKGIFLDSDVLPVCVQDSTFYFPNSDGNLHLMALSLSGGSARQVLNEDLYMPIVEGNTVYGIDIHDDYSLVSVNMTDGTKTVLDHVRTNLINVTDSYIYYQTSGNTQELRRISKDGSNMEVVAQGTYSNINATSNYVYFSAFNAATPIYKTPVSGPVNVTTFDAAAQAALNQ